MKQKEVNFEVKSYLTKDEYEKDGCPVQYYEFNKHDYYGLVAVKTNLTRLDKVERAVAKVGFQKAFEVYVENITGDNIDEIRLEGYPTQISKSEALLKFLLAHRFEDKHIKEVVDQFEKIENGVLLIDGSLI